MGVKKGLLTPTWQRNLHSTRKILLVSVCPLANCHGVRGFPCVKAGRELTQKWKLVPMQIVQNKNRKITYTSSIQDECITHRFCDSCQNHFIPSAIHKINAKQPWYKYVMVCGERLSLVWLCQCVCGRKAGEGVEINLTFVLSLCTLTFFPFCVTFCRLATHD